MFRPSIAVLCQRDSTGSSNDYIRLLPIINATMTLGFQEPCATVAMQKLKCEQEMTMFALVEFCRTNLRARAVFMGNSHAVDAVSPDPRPLTILLNYRL